MSKYIFNKINILYFLIILILFLLIPVTGFSAETYYVRTDGHDTASGLNNSTDASTGAWLTVQKAANTMAPGDTVHIADGTYAANVSITQSGTSDNPITYTGSKSAWISRVVTVSASYIIMDNLRLGDSSQNNYNNPTWAVDVTGSYNTFSNVLFDPNNAQDSGNCGAMYFYSSASYNTVSNFEARNMNRSLVFSFGSNTSHNTIKDGSVHTTWDCDHFRPFGTYLTIQNVECYGNKIYNHDAFHSDFFQIFGDSLAEVSQNVVIENCYVHDSDYNIGYTSKDNNNNVYGLTLRNNIFQNVSGELRISIPNCKIYNNIFYNTGVNSEFGLSDYGGVIQLGGATPLYDCSNLEIVNNAFITNIKPWVHNSNGVQSYTHSYNYYGTLDYTANDYYLDSGKSTLIEDSTKVAGGDPQFDNIATGDFTKGSDSVLICRGTTIDSFSTDKAGNIRTGVWDIGPYESDELVTEVPGSPGTLVTQ